MELIVTHQRTWSTGLWGGSTMSTTEDGTHIIVRGHTSANSFEQVIRVFDQTGDINLEFASRCTHTSCPMVLLPSVQGPTNQSPKPKTWTMSSIIAYPKFAIACESLAAMLFRYGIDLVAHDTSVINKVFIITGQVVRLVLYKMVALFMYHGANNFFKNPAGRDLFMRYRIFLGQVPEISQGIHVLTNLMSLFSTYYMCSLLPGFRLILPYPFASLWVLVDLLQAIQDEAEAENREITPKSTLINCCIYFAFTLGLSIIGQSLIYKLPIWKHVTQVAHTFCTSILTLSAKRLAQALLAHVPARFQLIMSVGSVALAALGFEMARNSCSPEDPCQSPLISLLALTAIRMSFVGFCSINLGKIVFKATIPGKLGISAPSTGMLFHCHMRLH